MTTVRAVVEKPRDAWLQFTVADIMPRS